MPITSTRLAAAETQYRQFLFKGMGVADRVPLRLELRDLYVPLKARVDLPKAETWERELKLAGRDLPKEEREALGKGRSEPKPVEELLRKHKGLIILGDPGSGKTTFLKSVALELAARQDLPAPLPVLVPLSAYAKALASQDMTRLDDLIADYFIALGADAQLRQVLGEALQSGRTVIMLDGLDEVRDSGLRGTVVDRVVSFHNFHYRKGNKFLLTSRIVGYREVRPSSSNLEECTLLDFEIEEIKAFVTAWTAAVEKAAR